MISVEPLPSLREQLVHDAFTKRKAHHVNSPPTSFINPWPSFAESHSLFDVLSMRLNRNRPAFVPVPANREGLIGYRAPDLELLRGESDAGKGMRVTWLGHAGFLVQTPWTSHPIPPPSGTLSEQISRDVRGINILMDPIFSERTSPFSFMGPKRYTPVPITMPDLADVVDIDLVLLSHNHYDHADAAALKYFYDRRKGSIKFLVGLGNSRWLRPVLGLGFGMDEDCIVEMDWWDCVQVELKTDGEGSNDSINGEDEAKSTSRVKITCTPSQHTSARGPFDKNKDLWCSFVIEEVVPGSDAISSTAEGNKTSTAANPSPTEPQDSNVNGVASASKTPDKASSIVEPKRIYFAGDTGYMTIPSNPETSPSDDKPTPCPAFRDIGHIFKPIHLSLLPISPCEPRSFVSGVHTNPADAIAIHRDICSQRSIAMHWGTVRGGLSAQYEEVTLAGREWKAEAEKAGLKYGWGVGRKDTEDEDWEIGGIDVGETLVL